MARVPTAIRDGSKRLSGHTPCGTVLQHFYDVFDPIGVLNMLAIDS